MRPERVFLTRPTLGAGGADRVTLTLLEHFDRSLVQPILVLMRREGELLEQVPKDVSVVNLDAPSLWRAARPLRRAIERHRPGVVLSTSSGMNLPAALACRRTSRPRLILSERSALRRDRALWKQWTLLFAKRLLYPRADCVTTVSHGVANDLREELGLPSALIQVLDNPVVSREFETRAGEPIDETWFNAGVPVIVAAGRLQRVKGFDVLLNALARVAEVKPCRLLLLGEGPERARLEDQARHLGVTESLSMPGFVPNPGAFMSRASIFVLPSRNEGLPGALVQAMALGTACIATDCDHGPREIIEEGVDGMLVPVDNPEALAQAVLSLLGNAELAERLGRAGVRSVRRFSVVNSVARYTDVILGLSR